MTSERQTISLCMIVKNEEKNIAECLESFEGLFDEIIIVDTGSTDHTKAAAKKHGARVYDFPWINDFSAARNKSLDLVTKQWVFWLDADHRIDATNKELLKQLLLSLQPGKFAYMMKEISDRHLADKSISASPTVIYYPRLFSYDRRLRWRYRVHEQILLSLQEQGYQRIPTEISIQHMGYVNEELARKKLERNLKILEIEAYAQTADRFNLSHTLFELGRAYRGLGHYPQSIAAFRKAIEITPPEDPYYLFLLPELMLAYIDARQWENALNACQKAQKQRFTADLLFHESRIWENLGQIQHAKERLEKIIDGNYTLSSPELTVAKIHHNLGFYNLQLGLHSLAEEQWRLALKADSQLAASWLALTDSWLQQKRWKELEEAIATLEAQKQMELATIVKARMLSAQNEIFQAVSLLKTYRSQHPKSIWISLVLSDLLQSTGMDLPLAKQLVDEILLLDPNNQNAKLLKSKLI